MKINLKEMKGEKLQEIVNLYIKERKYFIWDITLEEFVEHYVRECECCANLVVLEERDVELEERTMWNGKVCKCCESCCDEVDSENE